MEAVMTRMKRVVERTIAIPVIIPTVFLSWDLPNYDARMPRFTT